MFLGVFLLACFLGAVVPGRFREEWSGELSFASLQLVTKAFDTER